MCKKPKSHLEIDSASGIRKSSPSCQSPVHPTSLCHEKSNRNQANGSMCWHPQGTAQCMEARSLMSAAQPLTALGPQLCKPSLLGLDPLGAGMQETTQFLATASADCVGCSPRPGSPCTQTSPRARQPTRFVRRALQEQARHARGTGCGAYEFLQGSAEAACQRTGSSWPNCCNMALCLLQDMSCAEHATPGPAKCHLRGQEGREASKY